MRILVTTPGTTCVLSTLVRRIDSGSHDGGGHDGGGDGGNWHVKKGL